MEYTKGRKLEEGQRIRIYMNRSDSVFSIADHKSGLVVAYAQQVTVSNATFKVRESGRQRVLQTKQKKCSRLGYWAFYLCRRRTSRHL